MMFTQPPPRSALKWAAVDLDGTLAEPVWTADNPTPEIGAPIDNNVDKVLSLERAGYKIVIHTSRAWTDYEAIEAWLDHHGIPWSRIVCGKLLAAVYIDDRALNADAESWTPTVKAEPIEDGDTVTGRCTMPRYAGEWVTGALLPKRPYAVSNEEADERTIRPLTGCRNYDDRYVDAGSLVLVAKGGIRSAPFIRDADGDVYRREPDGSYLRWVHDNRHVFRWSTGLRWSFEQIEGDYAPIVVAADPSPAR